eukprot:scaffold576_cov336-Pavlova_lutheri.AAC.11
MALSAESGPCCPICLSNSPHMNPFKTGSLPRTTPGSVPRGSDERSRASLSARLFTFPPSALVPLPFLRLGCEVDGVSLSSGAFEPLLAPLENPNASNSSRSSSKPNSPSIPPRPLRSSPSLPGRSMTPKRAAAGDSAYGVPARLASEAASTSRFCVHRDELPLPDLEPAPPLEPLLPPPRPPLPPPPRGPGPRPSPPPGIIGCDVRAHSEAAGRGRGATRPYARRRGRCRRGGGTSTEAEGRRVRFLCGTGKDLDPSRREGGASKRASEFRPRRRGAVFLPGGETVGATRAPVPDPRRRVENERAQGRSVSTPVEGASETRPPPGLDRRKIRPMWWIVHVPRPLGRPGPPVCHRGGLRCVPAWQGSFLDLLRVDPGEWTNPG